MFKNLIITVVLSLALTASIISCSFNLYNRVYISNKRVDVQVYQAPIVQHILAAVAWLKANVTRGKHDGSSKGGPPKPAKPK